MDLDRTSLDLFTVALVVLVLVLLVLLVLCWVLRKNRSVTELRISGPSQVVTIRTQEDHAQKILDQLLDLMSDQTGSRPGLNPTAEEQSGPSQTGLNQTRTQQSPSTSSKSNTALEELQGTLRGWTAPFRTKTKL